MLPRMLLAAATLLALGACARSPRTRIPDPPETLAVVWKREGLERPPLQSAPQAIRAWRPSEWLRASYRSYASVVLVDVWRMPSESVAFEARQQWRNETGAVASQWRDLFLVCSSGVESTQGLAEFSARLEAEWLATGR